MKQRFLQAFGLVALGALAQAQTASNGPYYASPSWDQQLPASTRFVVLTNRNGEALLDRETGMVWQRAPTNTSVVWSLALARCRVVVTGGRAGWRLPTHEEIRTLVDPSASSPPLLPAGHPFQGIGPFDQFWTSSSDENGSTDAYLGGFNCGACSALATKATVS